MARDLACDRCSILFQNHRLGEVNSSRAGRGWQRANHYAVFFYLDEAENRTIE